MKRFAFLASLAISAAAAFSACSSNTSPNTPVTLNFPTKSLALNANRTTDSTTAKLSCGCAFRMDSMQVVGESCIRFNTDSLVPYRHAQTVVAIADPTNASQGLHTSKLIFTVYHTYKGVDYVFHDTILASYTK